MNNATTWERALEFAKRNVPDALVTVELVNIPTEVEFMENRYVQVLEGPTQAKLEKAAREHMSLMNEYNTQDVRIACGLSILQRIVKTLPRFEKELVVQYLDENIYSNAEKLFGEEQ